MDHVDIAKHIAYHILLRDTWSLGARECVNPRFLPYSCVTWSRTSLQTVLDAYGVDDCSIHSYSGLNF